MRAFRSEYWKSQPRKFCDFCKCWLSDNKASIEFHESGRRHQAAVATRLEEIGRKGAKDERKAKKQEEWLQKMEQAAMNDYRKKDLAGDNKDLTAAIFHQKRGQRGEAAPAAVAAGASHDVEGGNKSAETERRSESPVDEDSGSFKLRKIEAPKTGTKWHNPPTPKHWFEAVTDDGTTYFWHIETHGENQLMGYVFLR